MTNDEAIKELKDWHDLAQFDGLNRPKSMREFNPKLADALEMAIDALQGNVIIPRPFPITLLDLELKYTAGVRYGYELAERDKDKENAQKWRAITKRPMTDEERTDFAERFGCDIEDEDAVIFDNLPEDGKEVLVCTWYGHIYIDTLYRDDQGCYFEDAGDMEGVLAWMPLPKPYKEDNK